MPLYRNLLPADIPVLLEYSGLKQWNWPARRSAEGFGDWVFLAGPAWLDTYELAAHVKEYLEKGCTQSRRAESKNTGASIDATNNELIAFAKSIGEIRSWPDGDEVMQDVALIAVADPTELRLEHLPADFARLTAIFKALDHLAESAKPISPTFYNDGLYSPGKDTIVDQLIAARAWALDELIDYEAPWSGREPYKVVEVIALLMVARDVIKRAILTEALMAARIDDCVASGESQFSAPSPRRRSVDI